MSTTRIYSHQDLMNDRTHFDVELPLIAHGDSWASFGDIPPTKTRALLDHFDFGRNVGIVNYAMPGQLLCDLTDPKRYSKFHLAMTLRGMPKWRAVLISGGGNDLIDWMSHGQGSELSHRLLRWPTEWLAKELGPARYLSEGGWVSLCQNMLEAYRQFDALRAASSNPDARLITHCYDFMVPRSAPAAGGLLGPWFAPKLAQAGIPSADWPAVAHLVVEWFYSFLVHQVQPQVRNFVVLDTRGAATPAIPGSTGVSGDWQNEIHLTSEGYGKLAKAKCNTALQALASSW